MDESEEPVSGASNKVCRNCGAPLGGYRFCPNCGQRADTHILTFRELIEEFMDGLFNMDSRLWHSLVPLVIAPGKLTNEYLKGRRMHYLPPFRLYLILSVLFFLIPNDGLNYNGDNDNNINQERVTETRQSTQDVQDELAGEFGVEFNDRVASGQDPSSFCIDNDLPLGPVTASLFRESCLKLVDDPGRFFDALSDAMPIIMIATIPLSALVMQLLYGFSGRRYVEHIVFMFHLHAFIFMISILMAISSLLGFYYPFLSGAMNTFRIIAGWYILGYLLLALSKVYGGSKAAIVGKTCVITISYGGFFSLVTLVGAMFTALSI